MCTKSQPHGFRPTLLGAWKAAKNP